METKNEIPVDIATANIDPHTFGLAPIPEPISVEGRTMLYSPAKRDWVEILPANEQTRRTTEAALDTFSPEAFVAVVDDTRRRLDPESGFRPFDDYLPHATPLVCRIAPNPPTPEYLAKLELGQHSRTGAPLSVRLAATIWDLTRIPRGPMGFETLLDLLDSIELGEETSVVNYESVRMAIKTLAGGESTELSIEDLGPVLRVTKTHKSGPASTISIPRKIELRLRWGLPELVLSTAFLLRVPFDAAGKAPTFVLAPVDPVGDGLRARLALSALLARTIAADELPFDVFVV